MNRFYNAVALVYFVSATVALMGMAVLLLVSAIWGLLASAPTQGDIVDAVLESIGLLIIGFAIIETAKFIAEEEILSHRELRSSLESRRSLTKFITIIVIAASLEALVMVFKTSRTDVSDAIYPAVLFIASMFALMSLGAYQWLSSRIDRSTPADEGERDVEQQREAERSG